MSLPATILSLVEEESALDFLQSNPSVIQQITELLTPYGFVPTGSNDYYVWWDRDHTGPRGRATGLRVVTDKGANEKYAIKLSAHVEQPDGSLRLAYHNTKLTLAELAPKVAEVLNNLGLPEKP